MKVSEITLKESYQEGDLCTIDVYSFDVKTDTALPINEYTAHIEEHENDFYVLVGDLHNVLSEKEFSSKDAAIKFATSQLKKYRNICLN